VFQGIQFGIVLAFLVGPVFFTIIQTSVEKGFWRGALVALGVSASDVLCVVICYFGLVQFAESPDFKINLSYAGSATLIVFGLYHLAVKSRKSLSPAEDMRRERGAFRYVLKGFVINGLSPTVLIFWIGTVSVASLDFGYSKGIEFLLFFSAVLTTVLGTDILKAYLAGRLRRLVTPRSLMIINVALGLGMIFFGVRLVIKVLA